MFVIRPFVTVVITLYYIFNAHYDDDDDDDDDNDNVDDLGTQLFATQLFDTRHLTKQCLVSVNFGKCELF